MSIGQPDIARLPSLRQADGEPYRCSGPGITIEALDSMTVLRLHSLEDPAQLSDALSREGLTLTNTANRATGTDPAILCLRPGEWLLCSETEGARQLGNRVLSVLDEERSALLDSSDGLTVVRLSGPAAPWLLAKHSALDFLATGPPAQHCASTRLAGCGAVIHHRPAGGGDGFVFDALVDRSLARHLWAMLCASAPHATELAEAFAQ